VTDYAVMVTNLPRDCTEQELLTHFSQLYQLSEPDWRKRSAVEESRPVENTDVYCTASLSHRNNALI
jgi:RNA recognition motif-containing protein